MRVPARDQRQVYTGYVNEQGHGDTEEAHPKPPLTDVAVEMLAKARWIPN
jgi:hypothetical protein